MSFDRVMHYFREITKIPRGSGNTARISDYCEEFARMKSLEYIRDDLGNVVIKKEGKGNPVILQAHLDMVCESEPESRYDFENNGIKLVEKDGFLMAENTTLGADDGSGIAIMLAILEENRKDFPPIEAVFTVDEEVGMLGAKALDKSYIKGSTMINIDSENEGIITAGCAGGLIVSSSIPLNRTKKEGFVYEISVSGLKGGHSGVEIGKHRANANKLLGRLLNAVLKKVSYSVLSASGGNKDNAIPRMAHAFIITENDEMKTIESICESMQKIFSEEYSDSESSVLVSCTFARMSTEEAFAPNSFLKLLCGSPDGVIEYGSEKNVITSLNLGIMYTDKETQKLCFSLRSNLATGSEEVSEEIISLTQECGGIAQKSGEYPCWEYKKDSLLCTIVSEEYEALTGKKAETEIIHAGLECGIFAEAIKNFDAVSIGPDISDIHTPSEKMSVKSFETTYKLIENVLKKL